MKNITKGTEVKFTQETLNTYKTGNIATIINKVQADKMIVTDVRSYDDGDKDFQINNEYWFNIDELENA